MPEPADSPSRHAVPPILGWAVGAAFFFYAWILRVSPSVMVEELMRDFAVGGAVLGQLSALYFYGYAGMQIPVGLLIDRFGPRRLMTAAAAVCALGVVMFASSPVFAVAAAGRFLIGAGCAFSLVGAMAVAAQWFPPGRFALLAGLAMMAGMAGGVFGQAPLRLAVEASDWRTTLLALAAGALVLVAASWLLVRDRRRGAGSVRAVLAGFGQVVRNRQMWLNALVGLGMTGPLLGFAGLWGVPYLEGVYGIDRSTAAGITSMTFVGWGAGAPFFGWLSDRIGRRKPPLVIGALVSAAALVTLIYLPGLPVGAAPVLCVIVGFGGSSQIVNFAIARELNPARMSGTAIGFINAMVTGAGALFQPAIGYVLDLRWGGRLLGGARVYEVADFRVALGLLVIGVVVAIGCALALRETGARTVEGADDGR